MPRPPRAETRSSRQSKVELRSLERKLDQCMIRDRHALRRQLRELNSPQTRRRGKPHRNNPHALADRIRRSIEMANKRHDSTPKVTYPPDLPVSQRRDEILDAIRKHQVVVICGETGSGKTTQIPKMLLEAGRGVFGMIGHTQPRRIAARAVAARISEELNVPPGRQVGAKVRFSDKTGPETLVKVMTDGILLAETQGDRFLDQYDAIIIDEAHERSLNIDFLLGYLKQLLPKRRDLKVVITSATIDPKRFSEHFDHAPILEVSGRMYPVEVRYRPLKADDPNEADRTQLEAIADAVDEVMSDPASAGGDILIFQSGEREIRETAKMLRGRFGGAHSTTVEILPLYARLPVHEQQRIFAQRHQRRIVIATNVAETSLTVPGITAVIDPGEARISRYSARRKVQTLPVEAISQASADQRKGRCGRIAPGICIRLYSEADFAQRDAFTQPEIQRTNLASVILQMKALRLGEIERFPFIDPPKPAMIRDGLHTLRELGAIRDRSEPDRVGPASAQSDDLTDIGRVLARLPVDPRIGRMLLASHDEQCLREVLVIASALSTQDPRLRPADAQAKADEAHRRIAAGDSDFLALLSLWNWIHEQKERGSWNHLRRVCGYAFLSFQNVREWMDVHRQLRDLMLEQKLSLNRRDAEPDSVHRALLTGLLGNIGRRGGSSGSAPAGSGYEYTGAHNTRFHLHPGSVLFHDKPQWVMAGELVETAKLYARTAARISPQWIEPIAGHLVSRSYSDPHWSEATAQVMAYEKVSLYGLEIVSRRPVHYGPVDPASSRELFIHYALVEGEYRADAPFFAHNRNLIREIEKVEAKRRKRDVLVEPHVRYAFYDERIPPDVYSGATFEKWRKQAERRHPKLLFMSRRDLLRDDAGRAEAGAFPDHLDIAGTRIPLAYRHEPGHPDDGVTATIPRPLLGQIPRERLEWLVPGMRREKIIALIKSLPKEVRTYFVPAPNFADAVMESLGEPEGDLGDAVAEQLQRMTGVEIRRDAWRWELIPEHLRMNLRIVNEHGKTIAAGRDLAKLQEKLLGRDVRSAPHSPGLGRSEPTQAAKQSAAAKPTIERTGITSWDFEPLPAEVTTRVAGVEVRGYPALVDEGDAAAIRVFNQPDIARQSHRAGVRRLFAIAVKEDLRYHIEHLPGIDEIRRYAMSHSSPAAVIADLGDFIVDRACIGESELPSDRESFEQMTAAGEERLWDAAVKAGETLCDILQRHHRITLVLESNPPAAWSESLADVKKQLAGLLPERFLTATNPDWLSHLPRYLRGIEMRLEKLRDGGVKRDRQQMQEIAPFLADYERRRAEHAQRGLLDPALEQFRWMLEEYRISLFAQSIGTALPVSAKRLRAAWERVQR